jgi:hypothetical protein
LTNGCQFLCNNVTLDLIKENDGFGKKNTGSGSRTKNLDFNRIERRMLNQITSS